MKKKWTTIFYSLREVVEEQKWFFGLFLLSCVALFLYSYTQVDLSLTLSRASFLQSIEKGFQYIGYFNRPLSTVLFLTILLLLVSIYFLMIKKVNREKLSKNQLWVFIFILAGVGVISYTAFSYDFFNYIFDAKILTHYHQNPYLHKALDFPTDPMLSFMHWTHRTYPYGPVWLLITVPLSVVGLQYFVPTFFLFKMLSVATYIGCVFIIGKIVKKVDSPKSLVAMAVFAFNPLVIIELLVSGHNDGSMMFLALLSLYLLLDKKYLLSFLLLMLSVGVKFATVFLLPAFLIFYLYNKWKKPLPWQTFFGLVVLFMSIAVLVATKRTTLQPWYLLYVLPFISLFGTRKYMFIPGVILSLAIAGNYIPFLYTGNWNPPIPDILLWVNLGAVIFSLGMLIYYLPKNKAVISSS